MLSSASLSGRAETNEKDTRMKNTDTRQAGGPSGTSKPQKNLHFINPFTDAGFKRIFGQEVNKDLLMDFLNELLAGEERIEEIRFMDKEQLPDGGRPPSDYRDAERQPDLFPQPEPVLRLPGHCPAGAARAGLALCFGRGLLHKFL